MNFKVFKLDDKIKTCSSNDLIDYSDRIYLSENYSIFQNEKDALQFIETVMHLLETYFKNNYFLFQDDSIDADDLEDIVYDEILELMLAQYDHFIFMDQSAEDEIEEMFEEAFEIYMSTFIRDDYFEDLFCFYENLAKSDLIEHPISVAIQKIRDKPQPTQRTSEWYEFRHNLITASNAWKAFESQAQQNSLIYEKCQPMKTFETDAQNTFVNINSSLHWGQKYEPLSVLIYEKENNVKVEDFGCVKHDLYPFLGASPDGIITDPETKLYGRMLEIKNVVSREITGIPKKEYWTQMQLQMEVCNLDECDFLETKFVEYENIDQMLTEPDLRKKRGVIMYFQTAEGRPHYVYKVLEEFQKDKIHAWEEEMIESHQVINPNTGEFEKSWIGNYYWKLEVYSCVLIKRDRVWFQTNIGQLANIWSIIEKERISGYEHRAPKKRVSKDSLDGPKLDPAFVQVTSNDAVVKKPTMLLNIIKLQQQNRDQNYI